MQIIDVPKPQGFGHQHHDMALTMDFIERIEGLGDPEIAGDPIAAGLSVDPHLKQRILETAGVEERLERLERLLEGELRQARLLRRILAGAPRNLRDN